MKLKEPVIIEYKTEGSNQKEKVKFKGIIDRVIPHIQSKPSGETRTFPVSNSLQISYWKNTQSKKPTWSNFLYTLENQFYYQEPNNLPPKNQVMMLLSSNLLLTASVAHVHFYSKLIVENYTDYKKFLSALQIVHPDLKALDILSPDQQIMIWGDTKKQKFPLSLMGGGINHLMSLLLAISASKNGWF